MKNIVVKNCDILDKDKEKGISTKIEISSEAALWGRLMTLPTKFICDLF